MYWGNTDIKISSEHNRAFDFINEIHEKKNTIKLSLNSVLNLEEQFYQQFSLAGKIMKSLSQFYAQKGGTEITSCYPVHIEKTYI